MNEQPTTPTESSLANLSLADYRASRENAGRETPAATPKAQPEETDQSAPAGESAGESAAGKATADDTEEHEGGESGDSGSTSKPAKKGGFQRKIDRQQREIDDLKRQLAEKPAGTAAEKQPEAAPAQPKLPEFAKPKPKLDDFESVESFTEALTDWKLEKSEFDKTQAAKAEAARSETQKAVDGWNSRKAAFVENHPDYDDVIDEVSDVKLTPAHQRILLEHEHGPELAYQLAQDREQLEKFAAMHPLRAAALVGKLGAALSTEEAPQTQDKVSNAPRPIRTVNTRQSASAAKFDVAKASLAEYRQRRESGKSVA